MKFSTWTAALVLALLVACGGEEPSEPSANESEAAGRAAPAPRAELPDSIDQDEYDELIEQLRERPDRIIPYVPSEQRRVFDSGDAAKDALIKAIADGDIEQADRILGSLDVNTRIDLLMASGNAGNDAYYARDYTRAYRFDVFLKIDHGQIWQLDGGYIRGQVLDAASDAPVGGADVAAQYPNVAAVRTDNDGRFEVFVPRHLALILLVEHPDYEQQSYFETADGQRLMSQELGNQSVEIRLTAVSDEPQPDLPSLTFRGQVVDADTGKPLPGISVVVAPPEHNAFDVMMKNYGATTGDDGRFEIRELTASNVGMHAQGVQEGKLYFLNKESIAFVDNVEQVIPVTGRRGKLDVPVVVVGFVRDRASGEPIPNARVSAGGWKAERTGPEGRFLIQLDTGKDWQLTASHEAYHESASQAFSSPKPKRFDTEFLLDPITTGTILGTAINSVTGEPIVNAVIEIAGQKVRTDRAGRFRLEEVESGDVTVSAAQSGFRSDAAAIALEALQTAEATLQLEPITTGTIRGIVIDAESGEPVVDSAVSAGDQQSNTDKDGRFVLENVEAGMLKVAASKTLYVPNSTDAALKAMAEIETRIELTPITWGTVSGTVRDSGTGQPLANASIHFGGTKVKTNAAGEFTAERVPAGRVGASASLARYYDRQAEIELPRDGAVRQDFELDPITTGTIAGTVRDASTGDPLSGATVTIGPLAARTDDDGRFRMTDVPAGRLTVNAAADIYEPGSLELALEAAGEASADLSLNPITYGTVSGQVTNATSGAPLSNVDVRIGDRVARTRADGGYKLERIAAGEIQVSAERRLFYAAQDSAQLQAAGDIEVDLRLEPITTGTIDGTVVDAATGQPLVGVNVVAGARSAKTNAAGAFTIENVPAGDATVQASATLYESGEAAVTVEAAETVSATLSLTPITYGTINGRVVEAGTGKPLADARIVAGEKRARSGADGSFTLEKVPAGTIRISGSKPVYVDAGATLELAAGDSRNVSLELVPITWGSVRGVVKDAETGAPLVGAEVTVGATSLRTDAKGEFEAERVKAGTLQVAAKAAAYETALERVELSAAGEQLVTLDLVPIKIGNVEGQVLDAKTGEPIGQARVTLGNRATETDGAGKFRFTDVNTGVRVAAAKHPDYADGSASARVPPADTVAVIIRLDLRREDVTNLEAELARSGTIDLYGIYFDSGKDQFKPSSLGTLRAVLEVMKRAPERRFQLAGHTDADGSDDYNQNLSERRATRVIEWLVANGIDASRLDAVGYGETRPVAPNDTESGKALNRRAQLSFAR